MFVYYASVQNSCTIHIATNVLQMAIIYKNKNKKKIKNAKNVKNLLINYLNVAKSINVLRINNFAKIVRWTIKMKLAIS